MNDFVRIVEVGPRDGLQNETATLPVNSKIRLINDLTQAGIQHIETGSFVSPKWVPQMASTHEVIGAIQRHEQTRYSALVPNEKGLDQALESKLDEVAVFSAVSNTFCQKNINCTVDESLDRFAPVVKKARQNGLMVRGYVSCAWACPYEGNTSISRLIKVVGRLLEMGCYEISLGDTIGVCTSRQAKHRIRELLNYYEKAQLAVHFHDTYGQALANIDCALDLGIRTVDSSVAGLGGCPYAKGASGNVATEDVIYMIHGNGLHTGVDLTQVVRAGWLICHELKRPNNSKVARALGEQTGEGGT